MNSENKVTAWLGVATAIIGILAFFGITNYDELRNAVNPADIACHDARDAVRTANKSSLEPAEMNEVLVEQLQKAAEATEDLTLRRLIQVYADSRERHARQEQQQKALDDWWRYCKDEGAF